MAAPLPVLVATDSFKGSFSSVEVTGAVARGLRLSGLDAVELPCADGGEGSLVVLLHGLGGEVQSATVSDPLGRTISADYGVLEDGTAVVESAKAAGLSLLARTELDPWAASTRGVGELILAAAEAGAERILVGVGDTATTDGARGAIEVLQTAGKTPPMTILADVQTPFQQAAAQFGPQKGADQETIVLLEDRLDGLAGDLPRDPRGLPLTGAGGGLAGGLWATFDAKLAQGSSYILDHLGFNKELLAAKFVVTGEGRLDPSTLKGKLVGEVATRARQAGVACHAVVGEDQLDLFEQRILDLASVTVAETARDLLEVGRHLGLR